MTHQQLDQIYLNVFQFRLYRTDDILNCTTLILWNSIPPFVLDGMASMKIFVLIIILLDHGFNT